MTESRVYYKVVENFPGKTNLYKSCIKFMSYKIGIPTKRRKGWGPLCVFGSLERAIKFKKYMARQETLNNRHVFHVFSCHIEESQEMSIYDSMGTNYQIELLPSGTILANSVTLIEEIKENA